MKGVEVTVQSEDVPRLGWRRLSAEVSSSTFEARPLAGRSYPSCSKSLTSSVRPWASDSLEARAKRAPKITAHASHGAYTGIRMPLTH